MTDESYAEYFSGREAVERAMSRDATDPRVAAAHEEMAERYEALALVFGGPRAAKPSTAS